MSFFVGRQFVAVDDHHHGADRLAFWCPVPPGVQEELIAGDAERFFRPPYVGHRGWVGVRIDGAPDWEEIEQIVRDAYRQIAPKRLLAQLDGSPRVSAADRPPNRPRSASRPDRDT
ncbi:MAG TPA: MmcQ/YjbR family DNA-binding protein [Jatrophihabitantaceae bacterium]